MNSSKKTESLLMAINAKPVPTLQSAPTAWINLRKSLEKLIEVACSVFLLVEWVLAAKLTACEFAHLKNEEGEFGHAATPNIFRAVNTRPCF
jgi:hypothetical protein